MISDYVHSSISVTVVVYSITYFTGLRYTWLYIQRPSDLRGIFKHENCYETKMSLTISETTPNSIGRFKTNGTVLCDAFTEFSIQDVRYLWQTILWPICFECIRKCPMSKCHHCSYGIMGAMASQITSLTIVYSTVCSGEDQRKHQSSASLAFVRGIHRWPVNSPHKRPVTRKMFPFHYVIMMPLLFSRKLSCVGCFSEWHVTRRPANQLRCDMFLNIVSKITVAEILATGAYIFKHGCMWIWQRGV